MRLKLPLRVNFNMCVCVCVCCPSGVVTIEAKTPHETCTYVVKSCIHRHHVTKDFCTPVLMKYTVAVKKGSLVVGPMSQKTSAVARCYYRLELLQLL